MTKFVSMLNPGIETLDEILGVGKISRDVKGIGYTYESSYSKNMFICPVKKNIFIMSDYKSQHLVKHHNQLSNVYARASWVF